MAYATYSNHPSDHTFDNLLYQASIMHHANTIRLNLCLVSHKFKALGLQFLYAVPILRHYNLRKFVNAIEANHNLARLIRVIRYPYMYASSLLMPTHLKTALLPPVTAPFVRLERAYSIIRIFPESFVGVSTSDPEWRSPLKWLDQDLTYFEFPTTSNSSTSIIPSVRAYIRMLLEPLEHVKHTRVPPTAFRPLHHLQVLTIRGGELEPGDADIPRDAMPNLQTMRLSQCGPTLITLFAQMSLPSLAEVDMDAKCDEFTIFLQQHGSKLRELHVSSLSATISWDRPLLSYCPDLEKIFINDLFLPNGMKLIEPHLRNSTLECIEFVPQCMSERLDDPVSLDPVDTCWDQFIDCLHPENFDVLEDIQLPVIWPVTESKVKKSNWKPRVKLMKEYGITLSDAKGVRWERI